MATESKEVALGSLIPHFTLPDPYGKSYSSQELLSGKKGILVVFTCNHCPYAQAIWPRLIRLARWAEGVGIPTVAINPNLNPDYPDDSPEEMKKRIVEWKIPFPYLVDESQEVARTFGALCTPEPYLYDATGKLYYHGRFDDNWKDEKAVTRQELKEAIERMLKGDPPLKPQYPALGCSIKWRNR
jgi:peroxiredoxin